MAGACTFLVNDWMGSVHYRRCLPRTLDYLPLLTRMPAGFSGLPWFTDPAYSVRHDAD